ncbi:MAG TPA: hypothetical protein VFX13_02050 [Gaiellales bacterium]|nr:hypothetical protein [Gaiellales bacterium]
MDESAYRTMASPTGLIIALSEVADMATGDYRDQLFAYVTEADLGLEPTPSEAVVELAAGLPFWPAIQRLCVWQRQLWHARQDAARQIELAAEMYGPTGFLEASRRFLARHPRSVILSEQQLFTVQRLLIQHAASGALDADWGIPEQGQLALMVQAVPGSILGSQLERDAGTVPSLEDERWLRFFVGHGGLASRRRFANELGRAVRLYGEMAADQTSRADREFVDLHSWLVEEFGLTFPQLAAVGLSVYAGSKAYAVDESPVLLDASYFSSTQFIDRAEAGIAAISADRGWYQARFAEMAGDERREAFEIVPFLTRPALRQPDGRILPLSPRAVEAWTGATGFYYRLFEIARRKSDKTRRTFTGFHGRLLERYMVNLARTALPPVDSPVFVPGRVHGDYPYPTRNGEMRTPDVLIDFGADLICVEITSGQLTQKSLVEADADAVRRDLAKLVTKKVRQLDGAIRDLKATPGIVPGLDMTQVLRVWPVIVSGDGLIQTQALWWAIDEQTSGCLNGTQPLTLLEVEDYEQVMEVASADKSLLLDVLRAKTATRWHRRGFGAFWADEGRHRFPDQGGPVAAALEEAIATAVESAFGIEALGHHDEWLQAARRVRDRAAPDS